MDLAVVVAWLTLVGVWVVVYRMTVRHRLDAAAIFLYFHGLKLIVRPAILIFGFTSLKAPWLYRGDTGSLTIDALLLSVAWLLLFGVGFVALRNPARGLARLLPRVEGRPSQMGWIIGLIALTVPGVLAAVNSISQGGGVSGSVGLVRGEGLLDEIAFVRKLPAVALALSVAAIAYELWRRRTPRHEAADIVGPGTTGRWTPLLTTAIATAAVNAFVNFSFGDRSSLVLPIVVGWLVAHLMFKRRSLLRGAAVVVVVLGLLVVLGSARSAWIAGDSWEGLSAESTSLVGLVDAVNLEGFDRLMLLAQDWRDAESWQWGDDFVAGAVGIIPRFIWEAKDDTGTVGRRFRAFYSGPSISGWPLISWGEWYINWGPIGVLVSGLVAGLIFRAIGERYRNFTRNPLDASFMYILVFTVFLSGYVSRTPVTMVLWLLPLAVFARLRARPARRTAPASGPSPEVPTGPVPGQPAGDGVAGSSRPRPLSLATTPRKRTPAR